jgi:hypothetical protein
MFIPQLLHRFKFNDDPLDADKVRFVGLFQPLTFIMQDQFPLSNSPGIPDKRAPETRIPLPDRPQRRLPVFDSFPPQTSALPFFHSCVDVKHEVFLSRNYQEPLYSFFSSILYSFYFISLLSVCSVCSVVNDLST